METVSIIFGFQYKDKYEIPGIIIDIFRVYHFLRKARRKILVITDIEEDKSMSELAISIAEKSTDARIFSFIETLKSRGEYQFWNSVPYVQQLVETNCFEAEKIFIYYTGHAIQKEFIFPISSGEMEKVETTTFTRWIYNNCKDDAEILFFLDCCNTSNLDLPFLLSMDYSVSRYRSSSSKKGGIFHLHNLEPKFYKQKIICLCSSMEDEDSVATWKGSSFTQLFFQNLEVHARERNIHKLLKEVQDVLRSKQACRAYASYPNLIFLYPWLFSDKISSVNYFDYGISIMLT